MPGDRALASTPGGHPSLHVRWPPLPPRPSSTLGTAPSPPLPAATPPCAAPQPSRVATSPAAAAAAAATACALSVRALPPRPAAVPPSVALKIGNYSARSDAILLVIIPALQAPDVASSRALRIARELDAEGTRTIGVLSKVDQAAGEQKALGAVQALLVNQGPRTAVDIQVQVGKLLQVSRESFQPGSNNSLWTSILI